MMICIYFQMADRAEQGALLTTIIDIWPNRKTIYCGPASKMGIKMSSQHSDKMSELRRDEAWETQQRRVIAEEE